MAQSINTFLFAVFMHNMIIHNYINDSISITQYKQLTNMTNASYAQVLNVLN